MPSKDVDALEAKTSALDLAAKRALFAQTTPKPVFLDTAFNYIDMPMDELLVLAGKKEKQPITASILPQAVQATAEKAEQVVQDVKKSVVGREKTREATPAPDAGDEEEGKGKPKGWLGGWFGRK